jgi:hypothetical protein
MADITYEVPATLNSSSNLKPVNTEAAISRQAQEVQAAMVVAKRFPRDETEAYARIIQSCKRKSLAEQAEYEFPRGGQKITGPSIRLAETLARNWGNLDFGVVELEQRNGESTMMAYAWDLETNTRQTKVFAVRHERKAKGKINQLDDPRDVYELVANNGARRVRACILGIIPGDIVDAAIEQCRETLRTGNTEPLADRIRKMIVQFEEKFQVSKEMIEKYIGCDSTAFSENDIIRLRKVFLSLKDGMAKREDVFNIGKPKSESREVPDLNLNTKSEQSPFDVPPTEGDK